MNNVIKKYLRNKGTPTFIEDTDKMFDYPIQFQNPDGVAESGWIQDAFETTTEEGRKHTLEVVVLMSDRARILSFKKVCRVTEGMATPDWDTLHCAYIL